MLVTKEKLKTEHLAPWVEEKNKTTQEDYFTIIRK